mmetsp:Transcript_18222/g.31584  ORF Transcript_18222/g.31584 Transcript_18222/m.31584 type:complete len:179 (-) Transcript_18222:269-805(-)
MENPQNLRGQKVSPDSVLMRVHVSPYGLKLCTQVVMWVSSIIVFGSTAQAHTNGSCDASCGYAIATGVISFIHLTLLLFFNLMCELSRLSRQGWFTHHFEAYNMYLLVFWWIPGVSNIAQYRTPSPGTGQFFAFIAFFGSLYGSLKAYHSYKEEELRRTLYQEQKDRESMEEEQKFLS